ncbi:hypothetical protein UFOVP232_10 [uncultured Caudovirales phage]|uniref:Uncharacterized protein n=1 Tax=uncultured Caudovirales phage TaxID=2100421 RepID=A0A6J7WT25_9CAUD|nr:hypothetical protein UFOVP232_10 [uncultured Caudovirales phage]
MNVNFHKDLLFRLTRIETKLVRGFEELGVNIDKDNDWLSVDDEARVVYVSTLGRSMTVMLSDMARAGAKQLGKEYDIVHRGDLIGTVVYRKIT